MTKYLIVNADDFGISAGVSYGILEAHQHGIVTSTTVMINMPHAADSIRMAQEVAPYLGIGLHLNLSFGAPVLPPNRVPSLVTDEGRFVSTYEELTAKAPSFGADEVRAEFIAQFEHFVEVAGHLPDHFDSHHNVSYWHPAGFETMIALAAKHGLPIRSPGSLSEAQHAILTRWSRPTWPAIVNHEPVFFGDGATLDTLESIIRAIPDGVTELPCHPGHPTDLDEAYSGPREQELHVLTDSVVATWLAQQAIRLIAFGDLPVE